MFQLFLVRWGQRVSVFPADLFVVFNGALYLYLSIRMLRSRKKSSVKGFVTDCNTSLNCYPSEIFIIHFLSATFLDFRLALIRFFLSTIFGINFSLSFRKFINLPSSLYSVILVSSSAILFKSAINLLLIRTVADPFVGYPVQDNQHFSKIFL